MPTPRGLHEAGSSSAAIDLAVLASSLLKVIRFQLIKYAI